MIIGGTTPTHVFRLPFGTSQVKCARVLYAPYFWVGEPVVRKETEDCTLDGQTLAVTLTQEETAKITRSRKVKIQVRVLLKDGTALSSRPIAVDTCSCMDGEVIA